MNNTVHYICALICLIMFMLSSLLIGYGLKDKEFKQEAVSRGHARYVLVNDTISFEWNDAATTSTK